VDQLGSGRGRAAGQIVHFSKENRVAPPGSITGDSAPVYAAADDKDVMDAIVGHA